MISIDNFLLVARKLVNEMITKSPQYRIPLSNILAHKWVQFDRCNSKRREKEKGNEEAMLSGGCHGKMLSISTRPTSKPSLSLANSMKQNSQPPGSENGGKLFNMVNSAYIVSEESLSQSSLMSNLSRDYSFDSNSKRSRFSNSSFVFLGAKKCPPEPEQSSGRSKEKPRRGIARKRAFFR